MSHLLKRPGSMRPVMDPTFVHEADETSAAVKWRRQVVAALRWFGNSLLQNPLSAPTPDEPRQSLVRVLLRMTISWAILLPISAVGLSVGMVTHSTRPPAPPAVLDPSSEGCYFDTVSFTSADGTELNGWLVPVVDARRVLIEKDKLLRWKRPSVVLVHDFGRSPQQLLPLVRPLHEEGLNVLCLGLRGLGTGKIVGQTFGLRESDDVTAAIAYMRNVPFVDPKHVGVVGIGCGANAAMIAAGRDPGVTGIIVANPVIDCDSMITRYVVHHNSHLHWMEPLVKWTFELSYGVHADELGYPKNAMPLRSRPMLTFVDGDPLTLTTADHQQKIREFCRSNLQPREKITLGSAR